MVPAGRAAAKKASAGREPVLPASPVPHPNRGLRAPGDFEWQSRRNDSGTFEEMMSRFKQTSDEKMSDLKRGNESRRGYSRRGQQK